MQATIELESEAGYFKVSDSGDFGEEGVELDRSPSGIFSTEFTTLTVSGAFQIGGFVAGQEIPVRKMTLTFHLHDIGDGVEDTVSRFRLLWGSVLHLLPVTWRYTSEYSGERWLTLLLEKEIKFSQERDWNIQGYAKAVVSAIAVQPNYESPPLQVKATNPMSGTNTIWLPVWNQTDMKGWPEWSLKPGSSATKFSFADFSFGNEQEIDATWTVGQHASRMIVTPAISTMWSVMSEPMMDTYVAANLSNANGQMGGVEPLYWIPPHTGGPNDPVLLPVTIEGPAGAEAVFTLRNFWSAESGLER
jgi:hypothetical protein